MSIDPVILRKARLAAGLTTTEAGALVNVTRKSVEAWEKPGNGPRMSKSNEELFFIKLPAVAKAKGFPIILFVDEANDVVDCVAEDLYYDSIHHVTYVEIKTLATHRKTDRPYVHSTKVNVIDNAEALIELFKWKKLK